MSAHWNVLEQLMQTPKPRVDTAFLEKQRQTLLRLRASLVEGAQGAESDEAAVNVDEDGGPVEFEDDAQRLDTLEREGNLVARDVKRLGLVDRALEKIKEGTYGLSDMSGEPIPRERLEAVPEAVCTLKEEAEHESKR
jgi:RNA polymerase-binding transcription factor